MKRYWAKVDKSPGLGPSGDCWEWRGAKSSFGHGSFRLGSKIVGAHRFAYEIAFGTLPERDGYHGTCVCHRCDNPSCVNPAHLFIGSVQDNLADMHRKRRHTRPKGLANAAAVLTERQVRQIRVSPGTCQALGDVFGVNKSTISNIKRKKTWPHLV